jgi:hypothetical protein
MNPDINGQLTSLQLCAKRVAVGAGTQTFAGVDLRDYINNCKITIVHNEASGSGSTSIQYSLLDSADNTTFAASAYLPTVAANTAASATIDIALDTRNVKRYVQLKALTSSTTATFDIGAVLVGLKQVS